MNTFKYLLLFIFPVLQSFGQTDFQIESLKTFAKAYGYVKYFHPSDEASSINWDKFAIYGASRVEKCRTRTELVVTLRELFTPLGPGIVFYNASEEIKFDISSITPLKPNKYETTYWQHQGLGLGMSNHTSTYNSLRINRKILTDRAPSAFGNVMTYLNAEKYRGKTIKFTGQVKLVDGSVGTGQLWLRVDNHNSQAGFFDNMADRPITDHSWGRYEITGNVDLYADGIAIGCFLQGSGQLMVDDLHLFYMDDNEWIEIPISNSGFESEGIKEGNTWVARSSKDYDIKIINEGSYEGKRCVVLKSNKQPKAIKGVKIFEKAPSFGEFINKNIGSGISCQIPLVLYCNSAGTFPAADVKELQSKLDNINTSDTGLSQRLGDIVIVWNIFQHFYPYFDVVNLDWEKEMEIAFQMSFKAVKASDFLVTLQQFTAPLKDGHIQVIYLPLRLKSYQPRLKWEFIENKLVITKVCDWELKPQLNVGDIVTEINGMTPEKYFEEIEKRISAATPGWMAYRANEFTLEGERDSNMNIVVNNKHVKLIRHTNLNYYQRVCENAESIKNPTYKFMDSGIIYLNLDKIEMKTIDSLLPDLTKAKSIICDLRGYPNGNHEFISYLLNTEDKDYWMFVPLFIYPDRENIAGWLSHGWFMKPKSPHLNAKIIFIIDGSAISYAESYMGFIEGYKLATIVGQPTAGTNGNINPFLLPGGYYISWTGMKVIKHDGTQQHGIGILPNVYVVKTINGVIEGRDEFLEKALELARKHE